MIHTFPYSRDYDPPMPVVDVELSRVGRTRKIETVTALVDSGSDGTLLPLNVLETIGARFVGNAQLRGILGRSQTVDIYSVNIRIGALTVPAVRVAAMSDGSELILGRNALSQLVVTLNGLASVTEVSSSSVRTAE